MISIPDMTFRGGMPFLPHKEFSYCESECWIAENTGFTWSRDSERADNAMGVSWFPCSKKRHDSYESAETEARLYAALYKDNVMVRVTKIERQTTSLILNPPK